MNKIFYHVLLVSLLITLGCSTVKVDRQATPPIAVTIPLDSYDVKAAFGYMHREKFHVLLTNVSNKPVRLWQQWNSWGYYCLQIEVIDEKGTKHLLKKKLTDFLMNASVFVELQPSQIVVWDVDLNPSVWEDLSWLQNRSSVNVKLRAIFTEENKKDNYAKDSNVWIGQATSDWYDFTLNP